MGNAWARIPRPFVGLVLGLCFGLPSALAQIPGKEAPAPAPSGSAQQSSAQPGSAPAAQAKIFDINEYVVDGNTVLSIPEIEEAVYPFLGEGRSADDVDKARAALEDVYQARGYQTVQVNIPPQGVESGVIHLQVVENPVGRLRVVDSHYHLPSEIKATAPSVAEGTVPNMTEVQKDIVTLNQQADLKVTPQLKAGDVPGTVDVDLKVQDTLPLHASVEVNNQYNQDTTPLRVVGSISYDNLWQLGHSISFSYQAAPENLNDAEVYSGTYLARLPGTPVSLLFYGVKSDSDVAALAGTDVVGKGTIFGLRAVVNLLGSDTFYHSFTAGIDRKDLAQNVVTGGVPSNAPVLYYPMTLAYSATVQDGDTTTQADASLNFALQGAGSGSVKFDAQRFEAMREYFYFKADASRTQPLPWWGLVAYGKVQGQITGDSLVSSEQFSAGGENTVRGYLEAERLGDYGAQTTLELRSPSFGKYISSRINDWHFLIFADGATLWLRQPLSGESESSQMAGVGAGMRLTALDDFNAAVDFAFPLVKGAVSQTGDMRVHFRVWSGF